MGGEAAISTKFAPNAVKAGPRTRAPQLASRINQLGSVQREVIKIDCMHAFCGCTRGAS